MSKTSIFIDRAIAIHGNRYDYSLVDYISIKHKVKIICKIHGVFEQIVSNHINGAGCRECAIKLRGERKKDTINSFIEKAKEVHGDKYDYSNVKYISSTHLISIICLIHGEFKQKPNHHLSGRICKKCSKIKANEISSQKHTLTLKQFIEKAIKLHGNKYDYSLVKYKGYLTKIKIKCNNCGRIFEQKPREHFDKSGCQFCSGSNEQNEILNYINTVYNSKILTCDRQIIKPKELDIVVPDHKLAIEYNGLYWHSSKYTKKDYHLNKTISCQKQGYDLLHIFSDEWLNKQDIIKSIIKEKLDLLEHNIDSKDLKIVQLSELESKEFLDNNHIEGFKQSKIYFGLTDKQDKIYSIMSLKDSGDQNIIEINQFCNLINYKVNNSFQKLLNHIILFSKEYYYEKIQISVDRRFNQHSEDIESNFTLLKSTKPQLWYTNNINRFIDKPSTKHRKIYGCGFDIYSKDIC